MSHHSDCSTTRETLESGSDPISHQLHLDCMNGSVAVHIFMGVSTKYFKQQLQSNVADNGKRRDDISAVPLWKIAIVSEMDSYFAKLVIFWCLHPTGRRVLSTAIKKEVDLVKMVINPVNHQ